MGHFLVSPKRCALFRRGKDPALHTRLEIPRALGVYGRMDNLLIARCLEGTEVIFLKIQLS